MTPRKRTKPGYGLRQIPAVIRSSRRTTAPLSARAPVPRQ
jgi:hypothetical protein